MLKLIGLVSSERAASPSFSELATEIVSQRTNIATGASITVERRALLSGEVLPGMLVGEDWPDASSGGPRFDVVVVRVETAADTLPVDCADLRSRLGWEQCFALKERVQLNGPEQPDAVIRLVLMKRRGDLTKEDFERLWAGDHADLVLASGPLFQRYVTNIALDEQDFDGILEQWFADVQQCQEHDRLVRDEKPEVRADVQRFLGQAQAFMTKRKPL